MDIETFEALHALIGPLIVKKTVVRLPIKSETRLQICLRYLASGDSMKSVGYAFRCAPNTVSLIITETCKAIWLTLKDITMPLPDHDTWIKITNDFKKLWHFDHCIGAIDGKHIILEAPPHSGSFFYNYKGTHSLNLTGVADAHYRFILVDVGVEGRRSDAGVFASSKIREGLQTNSFNVPEPSAPAGYNLPLPYVLVGDEAYPLSTYLMRPYSRSLPLDLKKKVFNYRLCRARRIIENAFGILAARWRLFRRPINTYVSKAEKMVLATLCLHNFIITKELGKRQQERRYTKVTEEQVSLGMINLELNRIQQVVTKNLSHLYRERFADYFTGAGAVEWQWDKAANNEF